jgi:hypothetical protein
MPLFFCGKVRDSVTARHSLRITPLTRSAALRQRSRDRDGSGLALHIQWTYVVNLATLAGVAPAVDLTGVASVPLPDGR